MSAGGADREQEIEDEGKAAMAQQPIIFYHKST
jgi:hypothetical protein